MSFQRVLGQNKALKRIQAILASGRVPPALLFFGPDGVGKSLAALETAKALNCHALKPGPTSCDACANCEAIDRGIHLDVKRVNPSYQAGLLGEEAEKQRNLKVDTIRHLLKDLEKKPMTGPWKVAILEQAHLLVLEAVNALLKMLEEPPPNTLWILVTSQKDKLLPTVASRCHAICFSPLPESVLENLLPKTLPAGEGTVKAVASMAEGSLSRALELAHSQAPQQLKALDSPTAPFTLADSLPRELYLARTQAEELLYLMRQKLREKILSETARKALRDLEFLKSALQRNADPRRIVELAVLKMQSVNTAETATNGT